MRFATAIFLGMLLVCLSGCYRTTTKAALDQRVDPKLKDSFPAKLIYERSDDKYDYYRVDDFGALEWYRVPRNQPTAPPARSR